MVYRHLPSLLAINALVATAVVFGLWGVVAPGRLSVWLSALLLVVAVRAVLYVMYRHRAGERPGATWRRWFTAGSGAAACSASRSRGLRRPGS